jgi:hypothetical protein
VGTVVTVIRHISHHLENDVLPRPDGLHGVDLEGIVAAEAEVEADDLRGVEGGHRLDDLDGQGAVEADEEGGIGDGEDLFAGELQARDRDGQLEA